jgi:hypothetical protein
MSTLAVGTIRNLAGTASTSSDNVINGCAKAWVNYRGSATRAIKGSYNVSSVTFVATGIYTINFTTAFPDANYSAVLGVRNVTTNNTTLCLNQAPTASTLNVLASSNANNVVDPDDVCVAVFR